MNRCMLVNNSNYKYLNDINIRLGDEKEVLKEASPSIRGEESVGGSTPSVESDDDTLQNVHRVGMQLDEDYEHPKEISISRDIDEAEKAQWL